MNDRDRRSNLWIISIDKIIGHIRQWKYLKIK